MQASRVASLLARGSGFELRMPRSMDRIRWEGSDAITVFGTALPAGEVVAMTDRARARAYDVEGHPVSVDLWGQGSRPYLSINPVQRSFGANPEQQRASAPRTTRRTISSHEEEIQALTLTECDPDDIHCDEPGPGTPEIPGVILPFSLVDCIWSGIPAWADQDGDMIVDGCEAEVAKTFEPRLIFHSDELWWGREPYYSVNRRSDNTRLRIFYLLAYYYDAGYGWPLNSQHDGDSEFLIVDVGLYPGTSNRWQVLQITLSAHWQGFIDETSTYAWHDMEYQTGERGIRPLVHVSLDKHANYRTDNVCDDGAAAQDDCNQAGPWQLVGIPNDANIGNRLATDGYWGQPNPPQTATPLITCVESRTGNYPTLPTDECFWSRSYFSGWRLTQEADAGGYDALLRYWNF